MKIRDVVVTQECVISFDRNSKFDASTIINASAISLQSDSCKFQEDFRANVSRDGENLYRMIRQ